MKKGPHAWRVPVEKAGKTWRVHQCKKCGKIFISIQTAMSLKDAAAWAEHFDPMIPLPTGLTELPDDEESPLARLDDEQAS